MLDGFYSTYFENLSRLIKKNANDQSNEMTRYSNTLLFASAVTLLPVWELNELVSKLRLKFDHEEN